MNHLTVTLLLLQSTLPVVGVEFKGTVVGPDGKPSVFASVQIVKDDDPHSNFSKATVTNTKGGFDLTDIEPGQYRVYVWKPSAGIPFTRYLLFSPTGPQMRVNIPNGSPSEPVTIRLPPPSGLVQGKIVDRASSGPIGRARIHLELADDRQIFFETSAAIDGTFSLRLPPRAVKLSVSAPGYVPWVYTSAGGSEALLVQTSQYIELEIKLERAAQPSH